jgi:putative membrane protein
MKKRPYNSLLVNKLLFPMTCSGLFGFTIADALAQQPQKDYYGSHMMWNGGWYGMIFGPFLMIVFIGITVAVVVLIIRWLGGSTLGPDSSTSSMRDPLDILKERYARGEIEKEEYQECRRVLHE